MNLQVNKFITLPGLSRVIYKIKEWVESRKMINITYSELKVLRDDNKLIPGQQYRITDYITTTSQENTQSAGHQFDIIVTADSENTLNEKARAIQHEGDTYFANSNLAAWEVWYSLDNDEEKFAWADNHDIVDSFDLPASGLNCKKLYNGDKLYNPITNGFIYIDVYQCTYIHNKNLVYTGYGVIRHDNTGAWITTSLEPLLNATDNIIGMSQSPQSDKISIINGIEYYYFGDYQSARFYYAPVDIDLRNNVLCYETGDPQATIFHEDMVTEDISSVKYIENGKGVIYRMIDEWGNDCPYDFKNIMFKRNLVFDNGFAEYSDDGEETWVYTFAGQSYHVNNDEWSSMLDGSLESPFSHMSDENVSTFHDNIIKPYIMLYNGDEIYTECGIRYLNDIVFLGYWKKIGSANEEDMPYYNAYCCYSNSFGNDCWSNTFGNNCYSNTFGNNCYSNTFGNNCYSNTFGNHCYSNSFGDNCCYNSFDNYCQFNSFGSNCCYNTFGNNCYSNSFDNNCNSNSFGNNCIKNIFGKDCFSNSFGNYCRDNSFRSSASKTATLLDFCYSNHFDDGCCYNVIWNNVYSNYYNKLQNINVVRGVSGTSSSYNFINIDTINAGYEIKVAKNSSGEIKVYCEADLIA